MPGNRSHFIGAFGIQMERVEQEYDDLSNASVYCIRHSMWTKATTTSRLSMQLVRCWIDLLGGSIPRVVRGAQQVRRSSSYPRRLAAHARSRRDDMGTGPHGFESRA